MRGDRLAVESKGLASLPVLTVMVVALLSPQVHFLGVSHFPGFHASSENASSAASPPGLLSARGWQQGRTFPSGLNASQFGWPVPLLGRRAPGGPVDLDAAVPVSLRTAVDSSSSPLGTWTPGNVIASIRVGRAPSALAYDSANGYVYVTNENSANVSVINTVKNTVVGAISIGIGSSPTAVAYDSENGYVYVASFLQVVVNTTVHTYDNVTVIDAATNTIVDSILVGSIAYPIALRYDSTTGYLYLVNIGASNVTVINGRTDTVVGSIPVGSTPWDVVRDSANGDLFVSNGGANNLTVVNGTTNAVVGSIRVGSFPRDLAYDGANGYVYVADYGSNNVTVVNGMTDAVVDSIPVGSSPWAPAYDQENGYVYVTNFGSFNVTVINGTTDAVVGAVPVGTDPEAVVYDSANGCVYVGNAISDTVSVISSQEQRPPAKGPAFLGLPIAEGYTLVAGAAVVATVAVALVVRRRRRYPRLLSSDSLSVQLQGGPQNWATKGGNRIRGSTRFGIPLG